jgi:hypothetical protein
MNIYVWLNVLLNLCLQWLANLEKSNQLGLVLKLESKDILFVAFQLKKPNGQKPLMSRVGDVFITDR